MSHCWQNTVIKSTFSIKETLEILNAESLRMVLVVDDSYHLKGVVTDGDIRRGLLKNLSLSAPVSLVMNVSPITAKFGTPRKQLLSIMESKNILSIPILEEEKLVGIETLHDVRRKPAYQTPVFLMAGGFGTRLRPLTDTCPTPMLKIGDKPILETVIRGFIKAGFVNFYISTHYMAEQIEQHFGDGSNLGVNISYVHEESPLGTGGALGLLPKELLPKDLPLIMMNGDVLTKVDFQRLLEFHNDNQADATMCVREYDYQIPYGVVNGEGNKVTNMVEKPIQRFFVNAGIYVLSPRVLQSVAANCHIDMPTLLEKHMQERENVLMFPIHEYWLDIGRMDDFNRAQTDIYKLDLD